MVNSSHIDNLYRLINSQIVGFRFIGPRGFPGYFHYKKHVTRLSQNFMHFMIFQEIYDFAYFTCMFQGYKQLNQRLFGLKHRVTSRKNTSANCIMTQHRIRGQRKALPYLIGLTAILFQVQSTFVRCQRICQITKKYNSCFYQFINYFFLYFNILST